MSSRPLCIFVTVADIRLAEIPTSGGNDSTGQVGGFRSRENPPRTVNKSSAERPRTLYRVSRKNAALRTNDYDNDDENDNNNDNDWTLDAARMHSAFLPITRDGRPAAFRPTIIARSIARDSSYVPDLLFTVHFHETTTINRVSRPRARGRR